MPTPHRRLLTALRAFHRQLRECDPALADALAARHDVACEHPREGEGRLHGLPCPWPDCLEGVAREAVHVEHEHVEEVGTAPIPEVDGAVVSFGRPTLYRVRFERRGSDAEGWRWVQVRGSRSPAHRRAL